MKTNPRDSLRRIIGKAILFVSCTTIGPDERGARYSCRGCPDRQDVFAEGGGADRAWLKPNVLETAAVSDSKYQEVFGILQMKRAVARRRELTRALDNRELPNKAEGKW